MRFLPILPLRIWLGLSYLIVLVLPVVALLATGALGRDLVNQTRWDLEHQASLVAMLAAAELRHAEQLGDSGELAQIELSRYLSSAKNETLSGFRVVDPMGRVVATSGNPGDLGADLSADPEVREALSGREGVKIRPREAVRGVPLGGKSRRADVRVFVAMPIAVDGQIVGAVVVSRTPREEIQALYHMAPSGLLIGALFALVVVGMFAWFSADILSRSLRSVAMGSRRIAEGHFDGLDHLARPKSSRLLEVGEAAHNVEAMAVRLRDRLAYIGEFASNVSHEFKTPLSTLKGTLELLGDDPEMEPEQRQRFLVNAAESVDRLERMVSGLLSLARAEEGGQRDPIDLDGLVREVSERFEVEVEGQGGRVRADRSQVETVLVNFLENARVHGGVARVRLWVDGGVTGFEVVDDGPGISEANLPQVFDRFFTTNRGAGSSGLGLALVRAIVFAHGGEVRVSSEPGRTAFAVTLPAQ